MKVKTTDLIGPALDYAVSIAEGWVRMEYGDKLAHVFMQRVNLRGVMEYVQPLPYSEKWEHGGPIIERERIQLSPQNNGAYKGQWGANLWHTDKTGTWTPCAHYGTTPLIAAMRCLVAFKLGDEVEVPDTLFK